MIYIDELEKVLPFPVKIKFGIDPEDTNFLSPDIADSFKEMLARHNEKHKDKIDYIFRDYNNLDEELDKGAFTIYVGGEPVQDGKVPFFTDVYSLKAFLASVNSITEIVLEAWHDEIIKMQEQNARKIEKLEAEGYNEILYAYYSVRGDKRSFFFLKKLAYRYPNSAYMNRLRRVYRYGINGCHFGTENLSKKLDRKNFKSGNFL